MSNVSIAQALSDAAGQVSQLERALRDERTQFAEYRKQANIDYNALHQRLSAEQERFREIDKVCAARGARITVLENQTELLRNKCTEQEKQIEILSAIDDDDEDEDESEYSYEWSAIGIYKYYEDRRIASMNGYFGTVLGSGRVTPVACTTGDLPDWLGSNGKAWLYYSDADQGFDVVIWTSAQTRTDMSVGSRPYYVSKSGNELSFQSHDRYTWSQSRTSIFRSREDALKTLKELLDQCDEKELKGWPKEPATVSPTPQPEEPALPKVTNWGSPNQGDHMICRDRVAHALGRGIDMRVGGVVGVWNFSDLAHAAGIPEDEINEFKNTTSFTPAVWLFATNTNVYRVMCFVSEGTYGKERPYFFGHTEDTVSSFSEFHPVDAKEPDGFFDKQDALDEVVDYLRSWTKNAARQKKYAGWAGLDPYNHFQWEIFSNPATHSGTIFERQRQEMAIKRFGDRLGCGRIEVIGRTNVTIPTAMGCQTYAWLYKSTVENRYDVLVWALASGCGSTYIEPRPYFLQNPGQFGEFNKPRWQNDRCNFNSPEEALRVLKAAFKNTTTKLEGWASPIPKEPTTQATAPTVAPASTDPSAVWQLQDIDTLDLARIDHANTKLGTTFKGKIIGFSKSWLKDTLNSTGLARLVEFTQPNGSKEYDILLWQDKPAGGESTARPHVVTGNNSTHYTASTWAASHGVYKSLDAVTKAFLKFRDEKVRSPLTDWEHAPVANIQSAPTAPATPVKPTRDQLKSMGWETDGLSCSDPSRIRDANARFGSDMRGTIIAAYSTFFKSTRNTTGCARLVEIINDRGGIGYDVLVWSGSHPEVGCRPSFIDSDGLSTPYSSLSWSSQYASFDTVEQATVALTKAMNAGYVFKNWDGPYVPKPDTSTGVAPKGQGHCDMYWSFPIWSEVQRIKDATDRFNGHGMTPVKFAGEVIGTGSDYLTLPEVLGSSGYPRLIRKTDGLGNVTYDVMFWTSSASNYRPYFLGRVTARVDSDPIVEAATPSLWACTRGLFKTIEEATQATLKYIRSKPTTVLAGW